MLAVPCRNTELTSAAAFSTPASYWAVIRAAAFEEAAERGEQVVGGEIASEGAVVDAALEKPPEQCPDLLFCFARVVGGAEPADQGGVSGPAGRHVTGDAGNGLGHRNRFQVGVGELRGDGIARTRGQGLEQVLASREVPVQRGPGNPGRRGDSAVLGGSPLRESRSAAASRIA